MKKKFTKLFCLITAGATAFSAFGCKEEEGGAKTPESVWTAVASVVKDVDEYEGSYTLNMEMTSENKQENSSSSATTSKTKRVIRTAYNGESKEALSTTEITRTEGSTTDTSTSANKVVKNGEVYEIYGVAEMTDYWTDPANPTKKKVVEAEKYAADYYLAEKNKAYGFSLAGSYEFLNGVGMLFDGWTSAPTIAEYKAAFASFYDDGSTLTIDARTEADGNMVVGIDVRSKLFREYEGEMEGEKKECYIYTTSTQDYYVKDGKLVKIVVESKVQEKTDPDHSEATTTDVKLTIETGAFDQTSFQAFSVQDAPTPIPDGIVNKCDDATVSFNIGGYVYETRYSFTTSAPLSFQRSNFIQKVTSATSYENAKVYLDQAKTKELSTATDEEFLAADEFYVFADKKAGVAYLEKEYVLLMPETWSWLTPVVVDEEIEYKTATARDGGTKATYFFDVDDETTVYVNGVKIEERTVEFDVGGVYRIKYEYGVIDSADLAFEFLYKKKHPNPF